MISARDFGWHGLYFSDQNTFNRIIYNFAQKNNTLSILYLIPGTPAATFVS
ncbi:MAG: hypothetical protein R6V72_19820 [Cyclobacterium sp.]|uniref:hypothetical protein n=1 Tax=Cyclobacterium sp. TaxID=1966343 RepID=UPI003970B9A3